MAATALDVAPTVTALGNPRVGVASAAPIVAAATAVVATTAATEPSLAKAFPCGGLPAAAANSGRSAEAVGASCAEASAVEALASTALQPPKHTPGALVLPLSVAVRPPPPSTPPPPPPKLAAQATAPAANATAAAVPISAALATLPAPPALHPREAERLQPCHAQHDRPVSPLAPTPMHLSEVPTASGAPTSLAVATPPSCMPHGLAERSAALRRWQRSVRFDLEATTVHEITPYAEIYGLHPREFVFDRHFFMVPAVGFVSLRGAAAAAAATGSEEDEEGESEEEEESDEDGEGVWYEVSEEELSTEREGSGSGLQQPAASTTCRDEGEEPGPLQEDVGLAAGPCTVAGEP